MNITFMIGLSSDLKSKMNYEAFYDVQVNHVDDHG